MSTSISYPWARTQPGSPRARATAAGAVIALSAAIAGAALVAGIATGSAVEAPGHGVEPAQVPVTQPAAQTSPPITGTTSKDSQMGGGSLGLHHPD